MSTSNIFCFVITRTLAPNTNLNYTHIQVQRSATIAAHFCTVYIIKGLNVQVISHTTAKLFVQRVTSTSTTTVCMSGSFSAWARAHVTQTFAQNLYDKQETITDDKKRIRTDSYTHERTHTYPLDATNVKCSTQKNHKTLMKQHIV